MATDAAHLGREALVIVEPGIGGTAWLRLAAECGHALGAPAIVIGTGADARSAHAAGLRVVDSCAPPLGRCRLGWRAIVRMCAGHGRGRVALAFSPTAVAAIAGIAGRTIGVCCVPPAARGPNLAILARAARLGGAVEVVPFDAACQVGWPRGRAWRVHEPMVVVPATVRSDAPAEAGREAMPRTLAFAIARESFSGDWANGVPERSVQVDRLCRQLESDLVGRLAMRGTSAVIAPMTAARLDCVVVGPHVSVDALVLAQQGVPIVAPQGSAVAELVGARPAAQYPSRRPTTAIQCIAAVASEREQHALEQSARARQLPDAAALVQRIKQLVGAQRSAA